MKINSLDKMIEKSNFEIINKGENTQKPVSKVFCCDLLSIAMAKAPSDSAWVTVMGNVNTVAVASLSEVGCIILAESAEPDAAFISRAKQQDITVLKTSLPIFDAGLLVHDIINE